MKQFLILGAGRFGESLAKTLFHAGAEVLLVDKSEEAIQRNLDEVTHALIGDVTDEEFIATLGIPNFDVVIVAFSDDVSVTILIATLVLEAGAKKVVCKAQTDLQARILKKIGVHETVFPEREMGVKLGETLLSPSILEQIKLADDTEIVELVPKEEWIGKSIGKLNVRRNYRLNIIALKKGDALNMEMTADTVIERGSTMILLGKRESILRAAR